MEWDDDEDRIANELLAYRESWPDNGTGSGTGHDPEPHTPKTERNAPCPCGSGKKYKKCNKRMVFLKEKEALTGVILYLRVELGGKEIFLTFQLLQPGLVGLQVAAFVFIA